MSTATAWNVGITVKPDEMSQEEFVRRLNAGELVIEKNLAEARRRLESNGAVILREDRFGFNFEVQGDYELLRAALEDIAEVVTREQFAIDAQRVIEGLRNEPDWRRV